jgi:hypothetical protein
MAYRQCFSMCGDIKVCSDCFSRLGDDTRISHNERTDRKIPSFARQFSQIDASPHKSHM